jgi:hypothetical protein
MAFDPWTAGMQLVDTVVSRIWPDPTEQEKMKLEALKTTMASEMAIHATNQAEARHPSLFVAGWRPFIGWMGGVGIGYAFLVQPLASWVAALSGAPALPALDTGVLTTIVMTMLGFGGMRTYEKMQGVSRSTWGGLINASKTQKGTTTAPE